MTKHKPTDADKEIARCLRDNASFRVVAGAGAGKTTSLVRALGAIVELHGKQMLRDGQRAVCITYTNRAADVIRGRLRNNQLFVVSTLHSFVWGEIGHFTESIRKSLRESIIPHHIRKYQDDDNGGKSKKAVRARQQIDELTRACEGLGAVDGFRYGVNNTFSSYLEGEIGHDDLILVGANMVERCPPLRRILSQKYAYFLVDEAQDTSRHMIQAFNTLAADPEAPLVGYFGDPMQQIYDKGNSGFPGPEGAETITKRENYRCAPQVVTFLNAFRKDVQQRAAGENASVDGSVEMMLVQAESPEGGRGRYSDKQLERAQRRFVEALRVWEWENREGVKQLYLVRRMIARRLGFLELHDLFTGPLASQRAQSEFESGSHFLIKQFVEPIVPLVRARRDGDNSTCMRILTSRTSAFSPDGVHSQKSVGEVREIGKRVVQRLVELFENAPLRDVLEYCCKEGIVAVSEKLKNELVRPERTDEYDEELHREQKSEWLADHFFRMSGRQVEKYCEFLAENTPFSTQHGVKGEEYEDVVVVFDDVEAGWHNYSFAKMLAPQTTGEPRDEQRERSRKLAYVSFSRAKRNLRIVLFTQEPRMAKQEIVTQGLLSDQQIRILDG
ncbi:DNA-dependent helicase II [Maioricimonas rarisocia]|uniref:DNA-dependent helicase II n=1 Tax=Maioricimonas rarisocia TaxID=2528026 RepID=A0A517Z7Q2_9PLAN|nr:UvrD-helicase domain-containing protein [Maioricimonas rarisocia]QDU38517.1 DNA-dependent helicase II [Maioricimonas rarisocia]